MVKKCNKCGDIKSVDEYHNLSSSLDGLRKICKICACEIQRNYFKNNKELISLKKKEYRSSEHGKTVLKNGRRNFYLRNKDMENKRSNDWNKENREKMRDYNNEYSKEYSKKYPHLSAWRRILHSTLKRFESEKEGHTIDILGYSATDLRIHIESLFTDGMTWDNYGEWHIDHIKTVISFPKETLLSIVNDLGNLRPLWSTTREINGVIYEGNLNRSKY